jgi:hypothetical protein
MVFHGGADHFNDYLIGELLFTWKHNPNTLTKD